MYRHTTIPKCFPHSEKGVPHNINLKVQGAYTGNASGGRIWVGGLEGQQFNNTAGSPSLH